MYKYHLSDVEWGEFELKDYFDFYLSKGDNQADLLSEGVVPLISSGSSENGICKFIEHGDGKSEIFDENLITVDMFGKPFFHPYKFYSVSHGRINILKEKHVMSNNAKKYIIKAIEKSTEGIFSYNRMCSQKRLSTIRIILPVDNSTKPNWHFMEEYIKERENKQRQDLKEYYKKRLLDLVLCPEILTDVEWGEFSLRDLFTFERGNQNNMSACEAGDIPLISAKKIDNGVKAFISDNGKRLFKGHILTLNNDGDGGVGIAYYQANKMALDTHVTALIPIIPINRSSLLFISKTITIQRDKFSHGYSLNNNRMKAQKIVLPIDKDGNPNWFYMENFIKNIEQKQIKNILKYLDEYIYIYIIYNHFDKADWKEFFLDEICNINSGVRLTKANMNEGKMPFIGATDSNNGITNFVSNTNKSLDENVLGVNYNGSVVENFYHPYQCVFSDDVKRISFKDDEGQNKYCYLFLKQMILQQKEKYRYAYKFNGDRMARQKIMMPVDEESRINYRAVENYMRAKELELVVNGILKYLTCS